MFPKTVRIQADTEFAQGFYGRFQQEETSLRSQISQISDKTLSTEERDSLIKECETQLSRLTKQFPETSQSLSPHDRRTYSTAITSLNQKLQEARSAAAPRKKFAFKKPPPQSAAAAAKSIQAVAAAEAQDAASTTTTRDDESTSNALSNLSLSEKNNPSNPSSSSATITLTSLTSTRYTLPSSPSTSTPPPSSASLTNIKTSYIDLFPPNPRTTPHLASLTLNSITSSLITCGPIAGSAHMTGVEKSTLVVSSRQVRMHECRDCVVYLRCASRPIIEGCEGVRFAPLPGVYDTEDPQTPNLWNQVDDFKWLRAEPSPNWSVLRENDERAIQEEGWKVLISASSSEVGLEKVLGLAKVSMG